MTKDFDQYLTMGCMRCKLGGTPQCKVLSWRDEILMLRNIVQASELKEEMKWGVPVYTLNGKNVVTIVALKESVHIGFFKGVLMKNPFNMLEQQGNIQASRIIRFRKMQDIKSVTDKIKDYIEEAIAIEKSGRKLESIKQSEPIPLELEETFKQDEEYKKAFFQLTPGKQRGYIIHFSQSPKPKTRLSRILKYREQIKNGIGLHDHYKKQNSNQ